MIDLFIGRDPKDLMELSSKYQLLYEMNMAVSIPEHAKSHELQNALRIVCDLIPPKYSYDLDKTLTARDIQTVINVLASNLDSSDLFNILLRRSNADIVTLSENYRQLAKEPLDKAIRKSDLLPEIVKKIAVHAVRTATDIVYRDAMLLYDVTRGNRQRARTSNIKLGIRVCRAFRFWQHWQRVKATYDRTTGKNLLDQLSRSLHPGQFRDLMVAMAMV